MFINPRIHNFYSTTRNTHARVIGAINRLNRKIFHLLVLIHYSASKTALYTQTVYKRKIILRTIFHLLVLIHYSASKTALYTQTVYKRKIILRTQTSLKLLTIKYAQTVAKNLITRRNCMTREFTERNFHWGIKYGCTVQQCHVVNQRSSINHGKGPSPLLRNCLMSHMSIVGRSLLYTSIG